ncbi:MAG: cytochrome c oxidase subunit II [Planctomycetota bacterium]|nr:cytochrome c oxidase subunit II [Planctomycetota bacterium]
MMMLNLAASIPQEAIDVAKDGSLQSFWMPIQAAEGAAEVDFAFYFILAICAFFFFLLVGLGILFLVRYRRRPGYTPLPSPHHSWKLEAIWTGVPIVLTAFMFWFGFSSYMHSRTMPLDAHHVSVTGQKWSWSFKYEQGFEDNELHVAVGEPTVLTMRSTDVIHSFFIPAFRTKLDVVPGKYSKVWFTPTKEGVYTVFCAEYCGTEHSSMATKVVVHSKEGLAAWVQEMDDPTKNMTLVEGGKYWFDKKSCGTCHTVDGTARIGPSLKGLFGTERTLEDGSTVVADENYIRTSLLEPNKQIVAGFAPVMTPQSLDDDQIDEVIAYIKSLTN